MVVWFALVLLGLLVANVESQCTNNAVRLVWGQGSFEGNVQICINGVWGWVCDNSWSTVDAGVVCTQLGYTSTGALYRSWSYYGLANVSAPIYLDRVNCFGNETKLIDCPRSITAIGATSCGINEIAGVVCQSGGTCTNGDIRMIRSNSGTPLRNQGRVEVCYNSQWGTVCDDYWDSNDAKVACYQLGYSKTGAYRYLYAAFGQGYGPIYLDNVQCTSSETSLFSCTANSIGSHNCGHNEDAGVRCNGQITSSCTNGDVRLWRPYGGIGPEYFGLALYCKSNAWVGVCDDSYTCHTARLFCQQLGYPGAILKRDRTFWGYYNGIDHYAWSCTSSHTSLSQCTYYYHSNCNSYHWDQMGFSCYPNIQGTSCTNGDVRLVNGMTAFNGIAEYCFEGEWAPLCSLSTYAASLVCKKLGFNSTYAVVYSDERFGVSGVRSGLSYLSCSNSATSLSQCNAVRKGQGGCYLSISQCGTEMGLQCYNNTGACVDGSIRLVNGTIQQEGRVEVCSQGMWGSVCPYVWNSIDAYIVCQQLGYTGTSPISYFNSYFGGGDGPGIFGSVQCYGWENSIFECTKVTFPNATCNPLTSNIGIVCKEGCNNGDVRLIGGGFENEGTVQVCYGNLWGLISDDNWNDNNARVVCNQLGYTEGNAISVLGSQYGKPNMTIHLKNVSCTGNELSIDDCTKTQLSVNNGKKELAIAEAAGVDCIYDVPTDPPCISYNSSIIGGNECHPNGKVMLLNNILQFCYNGYWSPYCKDISLTTASVACNQLGYTQYKWASVFESTEYDASRNFSLFYTINCNGSENSLSQCNITVNPDCTPYCRMGKKMLRCFNPTECNTNGAIRLADGIIENEGRVEICVNNVWGSICSNGWDVTDAHVVCTQLGHPELKAIIFSNSEFGSGIYPIVYSNSACGGWESSFTDCNKQVYPLSNCSRSNVAGVLCGYDCQDGDVRLVGSQWNYEGTVQICYKNLWGLVSDSGWTQTDAEVICQQLGYEPTGSIAVAGSQYGKPDFTIHYSNVDCVGNEALITDCTYITYSLQQGKNMLQQTDVAGVKCYTPDQCVPPPTSGGDCSNGMVRFSSGQTGIPEGNLEYCYNGLWSPFCYLGPNEAIVACRQLGYTDYELAVTFNDGRFDNSSSSTTSLFQNISCNDPSSVSTLSQCTMLDSCQSTCDYAVGLRCYETTNCVEGDVRLVGGNFDTEGRVEVCHNNIWGTVCGTGFTTTDAYVVCKELGLGTSEPTIYTNSFFGDGDASIIFSEVKCQGFEQSIVNCPKTEYGSFTCSRDNVVGITCQDSCTNGDIRLVDGSTDMEGTILICDENTWGLIGDVEWDNNDAQVVCTVLGYSRGGMAVLGSQYSKPNKTILYSNFDCTGSEASLDQCASVVVNSDSGQNLYSRVNVAGVKCLPNLPTTNPFANTAVPPEGAYAGLGIVVLLLVVSVLFTVSMILYVFIKRSKVNKMNLPKVRMSGLGTGFENPAVDFGDEDGGDFDTAEKYELARELSK